jgi:hypothetical protein
MDLKKFDKVIRDVPAKRYPALQQNAINCEVRNVRTLINRYPDTRFLIVNSNYEFFYDKRNIDKAKTIILCVNEHDFHQLTDSLFGSSSDKISKQN